VYYVTKSGYDEYRLTKQNHATALLNTGRQGKLLTKHVLTKIYFYIIYLITPRNLTCSMYRGWMKIMDTAVKDTHFFINIELGHHLPVTQLVSFLE
jgi:hypothetical protein